LGNIYPPKLASEEIHHSLSLPPGHDNKMHAAFQSTAANLAAYFQRYDSTDTHQVEQH
jgi:hypothetical protein